VTPRKPFVSPCLDATKTAYEKMTEAITFAEVNRADVDQILQLDRPTVTRDLIQRHREAGRAAPTVREIDIATEKRAEERSEFKTALSNERWGWRLATMYALEALVAQELGTHSLLRELIAEVRALRADRGTPP
jgi:hypothetical protein